ncbi:MAG: phosphate ABC transporter, permease protein PstA, partial [candidate division WOR-3 bacterium]
MRDSSSSRRLITQKVVWVFLALFTVFTLLILFFIIGYITTKGAPVVTPQFLFSMPERMGKEGGILPTVIATLYLAVLALIIATPLGVGTAVYLTEYTRESFITRLIRFGADALAGVTSIIFG